MTNRGRQFLDIGAGIALILLAIVVFVDSANIVVIADTTLNARFYPRFLAALMILLSLIMIARAGIQLSKSGRFAEGVGREKAPSEAGGVLSAVETLLLLGAYVFTIEPLGFLLTTPFYVFGQAWLLSPKGQRRPVWYALLGVVSAIAVYCIFKYGFQLQVPAGVLE